MNGLLKISMPAKKLFDIVSLPSKKTLISSFIYGALAIVFISGLLFFNTTEKQISSQKAEVATLQQTIQKNNDQISTLVKNNASQSAQIKALLTQPTPTPVIETQYVSQSSTPATIPTPTLTLGEAVVQNVINGIEHPQPEVIQEPAKPQETYSHCTSDMTGGMNCYSY
jgi:hypothetical protein